MVNLIYSIVYGAILFVSSPKKDKGEITFNVSIFLSLSLFFNIMAILSFYWQLQGEKASFYSYVTSQMGLVFVGSIILWGIVFFLLKTSRLVKKIINLIDDENNSSNEKYKTYGIIYPMLSFVLFFLSII